MATDLEKKSALDQVDHVEAIDDKVAHLSDDELNSIEHTKSSWYVWLVAFNAAIGGLLFGYDTGVISGVLVVLGTDLGGKELTDSNKELITALTSAGAFIGAVYAGFTANRYGRKSVIWFGAILFTLGAVIQAASFGLVQMAVGRVVVGLGVGSAAMIVPLYIGELAPTKHRGRMIVIDCMSITGGQVLAYAIAAAFEKVDHGWRYMVGLGGVPSIILGVALMWCPESPRQLIYHKEADKCRAALRKLFPNASEEQVNNKTLLLQRSVNQANAMHQELNTKQALKQLYVVPANLRALVSACGLMAAQQLCGFNTLMYYSATLFAIVGFENPIAVGSVVAITNFLFGGVSLKWADKIGRRRILISTMWMMSVALAIVAVAFHFIPIDLSTLELETESAGWAGIMVLVMIVVFVAFYASGLGCIPWTANELLPMEVRAVGTMMITCTCWGMNIIISSTFLSMMKGMTPSGAFGFYAAVNLLGWLFVIFFYPEVAGMPLEQVRMLFEDDFGVKKARRWRKDNAEWLKEQRRHGAVLGA